MNWVQSGRGVWTTTFNRLHSQDLSGGTFLTGVVEVGNQLGGQMSKRKGGLRGKHQWHRHILAGWHHHRRTNLNPLPECTLLRCQWGCGCYRARKELIDFTSGMVELTRFVQRTSVNLVPHASPSLVREIKSRCRLTLIWWVKWSSTRVASVRGIPFPAASSASIFWQILKLSKKNPPWIRSWARSRQQKFHLTLGWVFTHCSVNPDTTWFHRSEIKKLWNVWRCLDIHELHLHSFTTKIPLRVGQDWDWIFER